MEQQLMELLMIATILTPIVTGFVELYKRLFGTHKGLLPVAAIFTGVLLGGLWAVSFDSTAVVNYLWAGALSGLASVGLYELVFKRVKTEEEKDKGGK